GGKRELLAIGSCLKLDLLDGDRLGSAASIYLPCGPDKISGERQKFRVLSDCRHGVDDRPVNVAVVRENDQRRASPSAVDRTLFARGLGKTFGEGACGIQNKALHLHRRTISGSQVHCCGETKDSQCCRCAFHGLRSFGTFTIRRTLGKWEPSSYRPGLGTMAITRTGLPEPFTIFSGAAITIAPVTGS